MMKKYHVISIVLFLMCFASCTPKHMLIYFQDEGRSADSAFYVPPEYDYEVKIGDNLYIEILSIDEDIAAVYNGIRNSITGTTSSTMQLKGYLVAPNGEINFPFIGQIPVEGKTLNEIEAEISTLVDIEQTCVLVRLVDRSITILGEVSRPGKYAISKNQINVYEALSLAGDITDYGNRTIITVVHQEGNEKKIRKIDITDARTLVSESGTIFPNDIVYVEPLGRSYGHKTVTVPVAISIFSSLLAIVISISSL